MIENITKILCYLDFHKYNRTLAKRCVYCGNDIGVDKLNIFQRYTKK